MHELITKDDLKPITKDNIDFSSVVTKPKTELILKEKTDDLENMVKCSEKEVKIDNTPIIVKLNFNCQEKICRFSKNRKRKII